MGLAWSEALIQLAEARSRIGSVQASPDPANDPEGLARFQRARGMHRLRFLLLLLALGFYFPVVWALVAVPPLKARVTDLTGTLETVRKSNLESRLEHLESRSGTQLAVLIVPTVRPETIEQYGIRVAEAWKLGEKGKDNGLLLVVAKSDREVRIEVGYGLEGTIPDVLAKRIIEQEIVPRFRIGDFGGGIEAAVSSLIAAIRHEPIVFRKPSGFAIDQPTSMPPPAKPIESTARSRPAEEAPSGITGEEVAFTLAFVGILVGMMLRMVWPPPLAALACAGATMVAVGLISGSPESMVGATVAVFAVVLFGWRPFVGFIGIGGGRKRGFSGKGGRFGGGGASGKW